MQIIENNKVKEKIYIEKLSNGIDVVFIPKKTNKKFIIWGINYGSINSKFLSNGKEINIPDGSAHYLEHKLFEQENGTNSLDVLSNLGVDANAYTTNNHTAYLFECTENFDAGLDELMDYVQNPYFTDENIDKERGIIEQEIMMYKDYPEWEIYMHTIEAMYYNNPIRIDVAGSKESIAEITKETLYSIYENFYTPNNSIIVVSGDFKPEEIMEKIKSRMFMKESKNEVERLYPIEPDSIKEKIVKAKMDISVPMFMLGFKDNNLKDDFVKKEIALDIIFNYLYSKSSKFHNELYEEGKIISEINFNYEYALEYSHVLLQGQSDDVDYVIKRILKEIEELKQNGFDTKRLENIRRKVYGERIKDNFNSASSISTEYVTNYFRKVNLFEYFEEFETINVDYLRKVIDDMLNEKNMVISVIEPKS